MPESIETFAQVLIRHGLSFRESEAWLHVGPADYQTVAGWKLHVSTISTEATHLFDTIVPCLIQHSTPFKIIKDISALGALNSGEFGESQIGKACTIYPESDDNAVALARHLILLSAPFHGPAVPTDLYLGGTVYTRYGAYEPVFLRNRLGLFLEYAHDRSGHLHRDVRNVPFREPEGRLNPFREASLIHAVHAMDLTLIGPGYRPVQLIHERGRGCVMLAMDLRSQATANIVLLKQGFRFCDSDEFGRDVRDRLRHQRDINAILKGIRGIPNCGQYFEDAMGNGYLPIDYVPGQALEEWVQERLAARPFGAISPTSRAELLAVAKTLVGIVQAIHERGIVHRDLSPNNVVVDQSNVPCLVDFELSFKLGSTEPAFTLGTLGYMSPDQRRRMPASLADDTYSLGCLLILILSGADPRRFVTADGAMNLFALSAWSRLRHSDPLLSIIQACLSADAPSRPTTREIQLAITKVDLQDESALLTELTDADVAALLPKAMNGLLHDTRLDEKSRLWLTWSEHGEDGKGQFSLDPNCYDGVSGMLYVLARAAKVGNLSAAGKHLIAQLTRFIVNSASVHADLLPGLFFGRAGLAVAVSEAVSAAVIDLQSIGTYWFSVQLEGNLDWPDLTHGAAGQGLAALHCAQQLRRPELFAGADRAAKYLLAQQAADGAWATPDGVEGMSGDRLVGFAHGAAGITYFLLEHAYERDCDASLGGFRRARHWIEVMVRETSEGDLWPYSEQHRELWIWWCHGGAGIALLFLRIAERLNEERAAHQAEATLRAFPPHFRAQNLSQCHGLSGLGEVYLEAYRILGDKQWLSRAMEIGDLINALATSRQQNSITWIVQSEPQPVTGLMTGSAGICHFLSRLALQGQVLGPPLLAQPLCGGLPRANHVKRKIRGP